MAVAGAAKLRKTTADVDAFLEAIPDPQRRADAGELVDLMAEITGEPAVIWTASIVGFGEARYRYPSGRDASSPSPRSHRGRTASSSTWSAATRSGIPSSSPSWGHTERARAVCT